MAPRGSQKASPPVGQSTESLSQGKSVRRGQEAQPGTVQGLGVGPGWDKPLVKF